MWGIFRAGWWPGLPPTVEKGRTMCSDCRFHSAAGAGWQWDRCRHPEADFGSVVRNDQAPTCADVRLSSAQCGESARWFESRTETAQKRSTATETNVNEQRTEGDSSMNRQG